MNIVVLGASGYLGSKIYLELKKDNSLKVTGTYNKSRYNNDLVPLDVLDPNAVSEFFAEHNPAVIVWCLMDRNNEPFLLKNGLKHVIDQMNNRKFIFVSTDAFAEGNGNYDESTLMTYYNKNNPLSEYANAKIDGEKLIQNRIEDHIIVRTGPIYGKDAKGNWSDPRSANLRSKLEKNEEIKFHENMYKTFVHLDDLASAIKELIQIDYRGVIHVGPSSKESYYGFNTYLAVEMGYDPKIIGKSYMFEQEAKSLGIPLDTSMNTEKSRSLLNTKFRTVGDQ